MLKYSMAISRPWPIFTYYAFEHCTKIKPIMLKIILSNQDYAEFPDCCMTALLEYICITNQELIISINNAY